MNNKRFICSALLCFLFMIPSALVLAVEIEKPAGEHYVMVNENLDIIHQTAHQIYAGDIYIAADNSKYLVTEIKGDTAHCIYQGKELMPEISDNSAQASMFDPALAVINKDQKPLIAVYHTHSDESYVPSDGKESIEGNGGIYDVGTAFVSKLESLGFNVEYSKNNHNPHDVNAYNRSRRTAASLIKKTPAAIIDVHRDAVPPGEYQANVNGQAVTKIKLVVGRTNPTVNTNMEFAKRIKAAMDKKLPGLSEGIFIGKGAYNQDLSPRAMLIEVGAHTNDKAAAEKGVKMFAEVLPTVLGVTSAAGTEAGSNQASPAKKPAADSQNAGTTILIILVVIAAAVGGFFLLNRGSSPK
ncbi:MAG: stage II sporulation protein P [Syntrophomonas sp.]|nr:stage II sporulation protein P [Syntrophomonas sp.]